MQAVGNSFLTRRSRFSTHANGQRVSPSLLCPRPTVNRGQASQETWIPASPGSDTIGSLAFRPLWVPHHRGGMRGEIIHSECPPAHSRRTPVKTTRRVHQYEGLAKTSISETPVRFPFVSSITKVTWLVAVGGNETAVPLPSFRSGPAFMELPSLKYRVHRRI